MNLRQYQDRITAILKESEAESKYIKIASQDDTPQMQRAIVKRLIRLNYRQTVTPWR